MFSPDKPRILALPVELYPHIFHYLDIKDIISLRKTCASLFGLTCQPAVWSIQFARLRAIQALPCSQVEFVAMSSHRAERVLFRATRVEASFLKPRESPIPTVQYGESPCTLRVLAFISDCVLLAVDNNAVVVWDVSRSTPLSTPWAHFTLTNFLGYACDEDKIYIAAAPNVHVDHQRSIVVSSVTLPQLGESKDGDHAHLEREAEFPLHATDLLKDMDPCQGRALLHCSPTTIEILHWRDGNRRSSISTERNTLDQGWNGIVSLRFCGPYVLCFRIRCVEAYPIPTDAPTTDPLPAFHHQFGSVCFRVVSLSRVRTSCCPVGRINTLYMLANDVYRGMFHYRICMTTSPVPNMSVTLLARGSIHVSDLPQLYPGVDIPYTTEDVIRQMFVGTWALGSAGLRGVWVDRHRGNIKRRVVAFTTDPSRLARKAACKEGPGGDEEEVPCMNGKVVFTNSSYDLRDDVTICAVSEWTGRIALGSRVGVISFL